VYLKDELGTGPGLAALGFTAFSVTMTLGRIFGDRLVARVGSVRLVRAGGFIAALGFGNALVASSPAAALVGFACLGAGMSSVVPIVFRAAGRVPGIASGVSLSAVSSVGYLGFVAGPPAIGGIAELVGLPVALGVLVILAAAVAVLAATTAPAAAAPAEPDAEAVAA
jgi:MFS family permease